MRRLGTAKVCITPEKPVRLSGFGFRTEPYEAVRDNIYVRVFDLREGEEQAVLIYGDLLWWNPAFVERMRDEIENRLAIAGDRLLFVASHNHSGPGTGDTFVSLLETADEEYLEFLAKQIMAALCQAEENLEEIRIACGFTDCGLNVYRRVKADGGIKMMPNYEVEPDRRLTVYGCYRKDGTLKGRIVHYPCHANLSKDNELHPDYPGYALEQMDQEHPGSISLFLQGCTADMRPNCVLGNQFRKARAEEVKAFASMLCSCVEAAARKEIPMEDGMHLSCRSVRLPVKQELSVQDVENKLLDEREEVRQWAQKVLEKDFRNYEILELSVLTLGGQLWYFFNAEMSMYYAAAARAWRPGAICTGYTNGMIGYVSTAKQIREGGYEPCDSAIWFAVAGTFEEDAEQLICSAIEEAETWKKGV